MSKIKCTIPGSMKPALSLCILSVVWKQGYQDINGCNIWHEWQNRRGLLLMLSSEKLWSSLSSRICLNITHQLPQMLGAAGSSESAGTGGFLKWVSCCDSSWICILFWSWNRQNLLLPRMCNWLVWNWKSKYADGQVQVPLEPICILQMVSIPAYHSSLQCQILVHPDSNSIFSLWKFCTLSEKSSNQKKKILVVFSIEYGFLSLNETLLGLLN